MGFKWAVYIAHTIADACLRNAFARFEVVKKCPVSHVKMSRIHRVVEAGKGTALSLHVIDDINCVFLDWSKENIVLLQKILHDIFEALGLPIQKEKSTPNWNIDYRYN